MDVGYQICIKLLHINKTLIHSNIDSIMVFKEKHMCSWGWQRLSRASQIQMCSSGITSQIPNTYVFFQKLIYLKMCWFSPFTSSFTVTYFDKERSALTHPESYSGVLAWDENTLRYQTENKSHVLNTGIQKLIMIKSWSKILYLSSSYMHLG